MLDKAGYRTEVLSHDYNACGWDVVIQLPVGTVGDTIGWFSYGDRFARVIGARVICAMSGLRIPLLRDA